MKLPTIPLHSGFILLASFWTIFILAIGFYDYGATKKNTLELARIQAVTGLEKDIIYRKWNAINGGVYGSISDRTVPNPYLKIAERDISTPSGKRNLTLINPAFMTRQVHELELENNGVIGHITSLNPIRPANKADTWETQALRQFERGVAEVSSLEQMEHRNYLRVMRPLEVTESCLPCHAFQGYKIGEVRGGISISVPMEQWFLNRKAILTNHFLFLAGLWALVLTGLTTGFNHLNKQVRQVHSTQTDLNNMKTVLDRINDIVLLIDPETLLLTYVNLAAVNSSGYSAKELLTMSYPALCPQNEQQLHNQRITELKKNRSKVFHYESTIIHQDGTILPVDVQLQYLQLDQRVELIAVVLRDSSSRKEHEKRQQQMVEQIQKSQKLESVGQLAAGIAHEINTPIQYIGSNLDFLEDSFSEVKSLVEAQQKVIEQVQEPASETYDKLIELRNEIDWEYLDQEIPQAIHQSIDGILQIRSIVLAMKDISHPGSNTMEPADINQLIKTTATVARNEWKDIADIQLKLTKDTSTLPCLPHAISQVLLNLFINAAHAIADRQQSSQKDLRGTITITTKSREDYLEIQIQDTGTGIPDGILSNIFNPFFTTKEIGRGTGQGLAIAHDIITNKHNGTIEVKTEEDVGTTFIISLPLTNEILDLDQETEHHHA